MLFLSVSFHFLSFFLLSRLVSNPLFSEVRAARKLPPARVRRACERRVASLPSRRPFLRARGLFKRFKGTRSHFARAKSKRVQLCCLAGRGPTQRITACTEASIASSSPSPPQRHGVRAVCVCRSSRYPSFSCSVSLTAWLSLLLSLSGCRRVPSLLPLTAPSFFFFFRSFLVPPRVRV